MYYLEAIHQHVRRLVQRWADAELRTDTEALGELLARGFVFVGPRGTVIDRNRYLYARASRELVHHAFDFETAAVSVYPDAAVVVGNLTQRSTFRSGDASGQFRAAQFMVRQAERWEGWKIACMQLTRIAPPGLLAK